MDKEIEIQKMELEERRFEEDLQLRKQELDFQREQYETNQKRKGFWAQIFSPVGVAVLAAVIGLLGTAYTGWINSKTEKTKQETSLILEIAKITDDKLRAGSLVFFADNGYLSFSDERKQELRKIAGLNTTEQAPPPSQTTSSSIDDISTFRLVRKQFSDESTGGELYINEKLYCYTLEHPLNAKDGGSARAIPKGKYEVAITFSYAFQRPLPLLLSVPGLEVVRIHAGDTVQDMKTGEIIVGQTKDAGKLRDSRLALSLLCDGIEKTLRQKKLYIEITEEHR